MVKESQEESSNQVYNKQQFEEQLNQPFQMVLDNGETTLTLVEVDDITAPAISGGQEQPFSIILQSDTPEIYEQKVYRITQSVLGEMDIFLVPVFGDDKSVQYEAIFT